MRLMCRRLTSLLADTTTIVGETVIELERKSNSWRLLITLTKSVSHIEVPSNRHAFKAPRLKLAPQLHISRSHGDFKCVLKPLAFITY